MRAFLSGLQMPGADGRGQPARQVVAPPHRREPEAQGSEAQGSEVGVAQVSGPRACAPQLTAHIVSGARGDADWEGKAVCS